MTCVYVYRLTADTGLAPCVDNTLLSLAVCKGGQLRDDKIVYTGLRYWVGSKKDVDFSKGKVYILGTYENKFLYLARITNVIPMLEYFDGMSKGRTDDIYSVVKKKIVRNKNLREENIHTEADRIVKDLAGEYVLLSDDYIYLGCDAVHDELVAKYNARFQETKKYTGRVAEQLVKECQKYADGKKHVPHSPFTKNGGCK